ncbi:MAG TPA: three-Cys-motif partner protein TcmP [Thermoanaerobaculia bacterium]|nr:three-Cys-motif partner protein TcmP [Thermoanaerobaculia bacterium]
MSRSPLEIPTLEDDGLLTPEVGDWAEDKYRLVKLYANLFTTSMRRKWEELIYIDLFAGAGRAKIRGAERIVPASPLLALSVDPRFDRHIFCEADPKRMMALQERVRRDFLEADARFVPGDVNQNVPAISAELPQVRRGRRVLRFCFVDPYSLRNLRFDTISSLAEWFVDFLVLIPSGYDATRNEGIYLSPENRTIDRFLGRAGWREEWATARAAGKAFDQFMTDTFAESMKTLGYRYEGFHYSHLVRSTEKKLRLYRLVLFSRHELGEKFWKQAQKSATPQRSLFD